MNIKSKLPDVGTTIFSVMTNLANAHGAINLSQGFPDFDVDPALIQLVEKYMHKGFNQYAPMQGVLPLREKIAHKVKKLYNRTCDVENEITVTTGATEALFAAITTVVRKGDEVIIIDPAYDSYEPVVKLCGGRSVYVKTTYPDYAIDWEVVKDKITDNTRLIILNSPHNPTGFTLKPSDIAELKTIVEYHNLYILSDEVYEHITFDGIKHESMSCYPELAQRSFVVSSFGKTYHATGWKTGYCIAPKPLTLEFRKIHQYLTFSVNTPVQLAYADFLDHEDRYLNLADFYQGKRDLFLSKLKHSGFTFVPCEGSYFQMLDYSQISDMPDVGFSRYLTVEHKVASIPPSLFYRNKDDHRVLRFCFAKRNKTLEEAAERLCAVRV